jgi:hypothetical protein
MRVRQLMAHTKMWPYPSTSANLLKLFTDLQVFLVTLTSLILKIDPESDSISRGFGWTGSLYGDLMWVLLLITAVPTVFALVYKTPVEKAQKFLHKAARVDLDDEGSTVAQRRLTLRRRVQDSAPRSRATIRAGDGTVHADAGRHEETLNPLAGIPTQSDSQPTEPQPEPEPELDIETIFREIDVDFSGQLEAWEFIDWWRGNGGDPAQVPLFEECFELVGADNDGVAGVSLVGFKKVLGAVAANDWLEKHSAEHRRPYWWNQRTGKSTWSDPGGPDRVDECVQEWLQRVGVMRLEV